MSPLSLIFGAVVGLSLGMTGGGGAIFAVPLLVYGLSVPPREAVGISLAAVGAISVLGFLYHWKQGEVEVRIGLIFAGAGMLGAPLGTWIATWVSESVLLVMFAGLMVTVAVRLWQLATRPAVVSDAGSEAEGTDIRSCRRDAAGALILSSRCVVLLLVLGIFTGVLSGLFGVGGGFVIVPALVLFTGIPIHHAVGTSLMVISLVSASGVASQLWSGRGILPGVTLLFVAGGIVGLFAGRQIGRHLSGPMLQKVFAVAMLLVAAFVMVRCLGTW